MVGIKFFEGFIQEGVIVLQPMRLVDHENCPTYATKKCLVFEYNFIRGEHCVELQPFQARVGPLIVSYLQWKEI